jgi:hypothetical protein
MVFGASIPLDDGADGSDDTVYRKPPLQDDDLPAKPSQPSA